MKVELSADDLIDAAMSLSGFSSGGVRVFAPGDEVPDRIREWADDSAAGGWLVVDFYEGSACSLRSFCDGEVVLRALVLRALR